MRQLRELLFALLATLRDMLPILITIGVFEVLVLGRMPTDPAMLVLGMSAK